MPSAIMKIALSYDEFADAKSIDDPFDGRCVERNESPKMVLQARTNLQQFGDHGKLRRCRLSNYSRRQNSCMALRRHAHQETNLFVEDIGLFPRSTRFLANLRADVRHVDVLFIACIARIPKSYRYCLFSTRSLRVRNSSNFVSLRAFSIGAESRPLARGRPASWSRNGASRACPSTRLPPWPNRKSRC